MEGAGVELLATLGMPIAMRWSNGALNRIGTFVFVFSCLLLVQDSRSRFHDTSTMFRLAFEVVSSSL